MTPLSRYGIPALFFLALLDLATTWIILQKGGVESNPVMAGVGFAGMVVVRIIFLAVIVVITCRILPNAKLSKKEHRIALLVLYGGIAAWWGAAAINNLAVIAAL